MEIRLIRPKGLLRNEIGVLDQGWFRRHQMKRTESKWEQVGFLQAQKILILN